MKVASLIAFAGLMVPTTPASAELPECNLFPDMQSRFACYGQRVTGAEARAQSDRKDRRREAESGQGKATTTHR